MTDIPEQDDDLETVLKRYETISARVKAGPTGSHQAHPIVSALLCVAAEIREAREEFYDPKAGATWLETLDSLLTEVQNISNKMGEREDE